MQQPTRSFSPRDEALNLLHELLSIYDDSIASNPEEHTDPPEVDLEEIWVITEQDEIISHFVHPQVKAYMVWLAAENTKLSDLVTFVERTSKQVLDQLHGAEDATK